MVSAGEQAQGKSVENCIVGVGCFKGREVEACETTEKTNKQPLEICESIITFPLELALELAPSADGCFVFIAYCIVLLLRVSAVYADAHDFQVPSRRPRALALFAVIHHEARCPLSWSCRLNLILPRNR